MIGGNYQLSVVFFPSDGVTKKCEADCRVGGKENFFSGAVGSEVDSDGCLIVSEKYHLQWSVCRVMIK